MKLHRIAEIYQEVLDEAARKQSSMLDVLDVLIGEEVAVRRQRALDDGSSTPACRHGRPCKSTTSPAPSGFPSRPSCGLFDCDFVAQHGCAVFIGPTGTGKSHLLNALGYTACEKGFSVRFTRVVDMINHLDHGADVNGTLEKDSAGLHPAATSPPR